MKLVILKLMNKIKNSYQYPKLWGLGNTTLIHEDGGGGERTLLIIEQ